MTISVEWIQHGIRGCSPILPYIQCSHFYIFIEVFLYVLNLVSIEYNFFVFVILIVIRNSSFQNRVPVTIPFAVNKQRRHCNFPNAVSAKSEINFNYELNIN